MRRLIQLLLSPPSRFARLVVAEKRLTCDPVAPEDAWRICRCSSISTARGSRDCGPSSIIWRETIRTIRWCRRTPRRAPNLSGCSIGRWGRSTMASRAASSTKRHRSVSPARAARRAPDMEVVRAGREALKRALAMLGDSGRAPRLSRGARMHVGRSRGGGAHLGAGLFRRRFPGRNFPLAAEWYVKMKSRPSFRSLLADRVPGQPPVSHYAELDG
jgi:glutathione S-transferase